MVRWGNWGGSYDSVSAGSRPVGGLPPGRRGACCGGRARRPAGGCRSRPLKRVTSRTLRHYDEIGVLPPARIGSNGHRHFEEADLPRPQQIYFLRELSLGLREIRRSWTARR
ncbi:MerR family transcriptional regulator [Streptomyces rectiviolaceus]|uniref:MerR family transcriptional regulator n=1 Tax=Streptomyces rectiviolaceus TaxID=332591 RepID=UPI00363F35E3